MSRGDHTHQGSGSFPEPSFGSWFEVALQLLRTLLGIVLQGFQLLIFPFRRDRVALEMRTRIMNPDREGDSALEKKN